MPSTRYNVGDQVLVKASGAAVVIDVVDETAGYPYVVSHPDGQQEGCHEEELMYPGEVTMNTVQPPTRNHSSSIRSDDGPSAKPETTRGWFITNAWNGWVGYEDQWERGRSPLELKRRADPVLRSCAALHTEDTEDRLASASTETLSLVVSRADVFEICGICLSDDVRLVNFSERCKHRFCRECLQQCATCQHDLCPLCRTSKHAPVIEEAVHDIAASGRREAQMMLGLAGRGHAGVDYFG